MDYFITYFITYYIDYFQVCTVDMIRVGNNN